MKQSPPRFLAHRRGTILIIAMIVLFAIAALVLTLGRTARTEALTAANARSAAEADAVERGAEQYALATLASYATDLQDLGDSYFSGIKVGDGYFWIIRPNYNDNSISTYGLMDETAKLNLNTVTDDQLSSLPFASADLSSDVLAWRGDSSTSGGSVSGLGGGVIKGQHFETVDEMRLLPSVSAERLYGTPGGDANAGSAASANYYVQHGIFDYFTVWGTSPTTAVDGTTKKVTIDQEDEDAVNAVLAKIGRAPTRIRGIMNVFELANRLGLTEDEFSQVEDSLTTGVVPPTGGAPPASQQGRINPNYASPEVLAALPLTDSQVQQLITARASGTASYPNSLAWVYDTLKTDANPIGDRLTARGTEYSAEVIAASGDGRSFKRVRIVIDTSSTPIKIIYRRDITDRGWPLDAQLLQDLRSGQYKASHSPAAGGIAQ